MFCISFPGCCSPWQLQYKRFSLVTLWPLLLSAETACKQKLVKCETKHAPQWKLRCHLEAPGGPEEHEISLTTSSWAETESIYPECHRMGLFGFANKLLILNCFYKSHQYQHQHHHCPDIQGVGQGHTQCS